MADEARFHYILKYALIKWESMFSNRQQQKNITASTRRFYKQKIIKVKLRKKFGNKYTQDVGYMFLVERFECRISTNSCMQCVAK